MREGEAVSRKRNRAERSKRARKRIAVTQAKRDYADVMRERYYRVRVKRDCRCSSCGRKLRARPANGRPRDEMVFRKLGPVTLCVPCADADPLVDYRTSASWDDSRWKRRGAKPRPTRDDGHYRWRCRRCGYLAEAAPKRCPGCG